MTILLTDPNTLPWRNAANKGKRLLASCVAGEGSDCQQWKVESRTVIGLLYDVSYAASAGGVALACSCDAGRHDRPCCHAAAVLLRTGHLRWFDRIIAHRDRRTGRATIGLVGMGDWERLSQFDGIDWGSLSSPHSRCYTAQLLLAALHRSPALNGAVSEWLHDRPRDGWEISADHLDLLLADAETRVLVAAGA